MVRMADAKFMFSIPQCAPIAPTPNELAYSTTRLAQTDSLPSKQTGITVPTGSDDTVVRFTNAFTSISFPKLECQTLPGMMTISVPGLLPLLKLNREDSRNADSSAFENASVSGSLPLCAISTGILSSTPANAFEICKIELAKNTIRIKNRIAISSTPAPPPHPASPSAWDRAFPGR